MKQSSFDRNLSTRSTRKQAFLQHLDSDFASKLEAADTPISPYYTLMTVTTRPKRCTQLKRTGGLSIQVAADMLAKLAAGA